MLQKLSIALGIKLNYFCKVLKLSDSRQSLQFLYYLPFAYTGLPIPWLDRAHSPPQSLHTWCFLRLKVLTPDFSIFGSVFSIPSMSTIFSWPSSASPKLVSYPPYSTNQHIWISFLHANILFIYLLVNLLP